jgi:hypothetical protein
MKQNLKSKKFKAFNPALKEERTFDQSEIGWVSVNNYFHFRFDIPRYVKDKFVEMTKGKFAGYINV